MSITRAVAGLSAGALPSGSIPFADAAGRLASSANYAIDPTTGALSLFDRSGDLVNFSGLSFAARKVELTDGTSAAPIGEWGPTVQISRTENLILGSTNSGSVNNGLSNSNAVQNDANAALAVTNINKATSQMQVAGVVAGARSSSTVAGTDAVGLLSYGRTMTGAVGRGTGAYLSGQRDTSSSTALGAEIRVTNSAGADSTYNSGGASDVLGLWITSGGARAGAAVQVGALGGAGHEYLTGIGFVGNSVLTDTLRDDSSATTTLQIRGAHTYGIDTQSGTFSGGAMRLKNSAAIVGRNNAANGDIAMMSLNTSDKVVLGTLAPTTLVNGNTAGATATMQVLAAASVGGLDVQGSGGTVFAVRASGGGSLFFVDNTDVRLNNSAKILFQTDGQGDIGAAGANRPNNLYVKTEMNVNGKTLNFYDFGGGFIAKPSSGAVDMPIPITRALTIPANMAGAQAIAKTGATTSAAFTIAKVSGGVTTTIGTLTFASGGQGGAQAGTFTTPSGAAQTLAAGDYVLVTAPTQDATLADVSYALTGTWY